MDFGMFASWLLVRVSLHQQTGRPQCYQGPSVSRMRIPTAKWALWLVLSIVSTAWLQQRHWSSRSLCRQHLFRNCGCKTHRSLQCRPVHTLQCPVQHFTITTFRFFYKRFITSATSWNDMHWVTWFSVISTAWLQQCQWSSCCLCTQHLMRICGCEAHCSLQCRHVQTLTCPLQHFTITTLK